MTHAARPPGSRDEMVGALLRAYWNKPESVALTFSGPPTAWNRIAELVQAWIAYERDLTRYAIDSKLKAEHERAIEDAAQCCRTVAEKVRPHILPHEAALWCVASVLALKVAP